MSFGFVHDWTGSVPSISEARNGVGVVGASATGVAAGRVSTTYGARVPAGTAVAVGVGLSVTQAEAQPAIGTTAAGSKQASSVRMSRDVRELRGVPVFTAPV